MHFGSYACLTSIIFSDSFSFADAFVCRSLATDDLTCDDLAFFKRFEDSFFIATFARFTLVKSIAPAGHNHLGCTLAMSSYFAFHTTILSQNCFHWPCLPA